MRVSRPLPPKLKEIIDYNWTFPTDFSVVNNSTSPDASRTLKAVIEHILSNYYFDHRIFTHDVSEFSRHFENRLYIVMSQHQYWIDQFLGLIDDNQFFYNDETQNLSRTASSTDTGLEKSSDTPQNQVSDINNYLTSARQSNGSNSGTESQLNTIHKSTLGDITVQFKNFANFPLFTDILIKGVAPCFLTTYSYDYDDDFNYVGFTEKRLTNPNRTEVYDVLGRLVATFTDDARTVAMKGPSRTFVESSHGIIDTFNRTNSSSFGRADQGGRYFITEGSASDFTVNDNIGVMLVDIVNSSRRATLTQTNSMKSLLATVKIKTDKAAAGASQEIGITFGYKDLSNHYEAVLRFTSTGSVQIGIIKKIDGDTNLIGSFITVAATRTVSDWWRLKVSWNMDAGAPNRIKVKAWIVGDGEPANWQKDEWDDVYLTGRVGLRSILNIGTSNAPVIVSFDDFIAEGSWPTDPVIVNNTYVRFLETPFTGQFLTNKVMVLWLIAALKDTSNDLLAELYRYFYNHDLNASYGPAGSDGIRHDGSDWHDYLSQTAYYPGEDIPEIAPDPAQLGCVDCSGYARLVLKSFGFLLSNYPDTFDHIHIPRESKDIMDDGPGVYVVPRQTGVQITDFTKLQIGDLVGFDADLSDAEEGQLDHLGFYIGQDVAGKRRFISSRSTPDGPTFADLGGQSVINGTTNLYTKSFRSIRRV